MSKRPTTIADIASAAKLSVQQVIQRLEDIIVTAQNIDITPTELAALLNDPDASKPLLLDVREPWEFAICHLPDSRLLASMSLEQLLHDLAGNPRRVVTICHHGIRSTSAALFLRERGIADVRSLQGGVELWAQAIDRSMTRY